MGASQGEFCPSLLTPLWCWQEMGGCSLYDRWHICPGRENSSKEKQPLRGNWWICHFKKSNTWSHPMIISQLPIIPSLVWLWGSWRWMKCWSLSLASFAFLKNMNHKWLCTNGTFRVSLYNFHWTFWHFILLTAWFDLRKLWNCDEHTGFCLFVHLFSCVAWE